MPKWGTQKELAELMGVSEATVSQWKKLQKLKGLTRKGKIDLDKAPDTIMGRIAPKQRASANAKYKKENRPPKPTDIDNPETEEEVKSYLDESIGDLAQLDIYELQKRNELEKLLMARIKRNREEGELISANDAEAEWSKQILAARNRMLGTKSACAPLLREFLEDKTQCESILKIIDDKIREGLDELAENRT